MSALSDQCKGETETPQLKSLPKSGYADSKRSFATAEGHIGWRTNSEGGT